MRKKHNQKKKDKREKEKLEKAAQLLAEAKANEEVMKHQPKID